MGLFHKATKASFDKGLASEWNDDHKVQGNFDFRFYTSLNHAFEGRTDWPAGPVIGHTIYRTDLLHFFIWNGTSWIKMLNNPARENQDMAQFEALNFVIENRSDFPASPIQGQVIYRTDLQRYFFRDVSGWRKFLNNPALENQDMDSYDITNVNQLYVDEIWEGPGGGLKVKHDLDLDGNNINNVIKLQVNEIGVTSGLGISITDDVFMEGNDIDSVHYIYVNEIHEGYTGTLIIKHDLDLDHNIIYNLGNPSNPQDGATKKYVDDENDAQSHDGFGDTANSTAHDKYLRNDTNSSMNTHRIVEVVDPLNNQDVATKKYVDDKTGAGGQEATYSEANVSTSAHDVTGASVTITATAGQIVLVIYSHRIYIPVNGGGVTTCLRRGITDITAGLYDYLGAGGDMDSSQCRQIADIPGAGTWTYKVRGVSVIGTEDIIAGRLTAITLS